MVMKYIQQPAMDVSGNSRPRTRKGNKEDKASCIALISRDTTPLTPHSPEECEGLASWQVPWAFLLLGEIGLCTVRTCTSTYSGFVFVHLLLRSIHGGTGLSSLLHYFRVKEYESTSRTASAPFFLLSPSWRAAGLLSPNGSIDVSMSRLADESIHIAR